MSIERWIKLFIFIPIFTISIIFSFNFLIDPYSMTSFNLLNIPNKYARDDRKEKVAKLFSEPTYSTMLFGSSHVYSINPLSAQKYLSGRSYNAGVGTARIEDHLGFLLYLKRINKLPKNIILGLDFYSFNQNLETNKYFLLNDDLNFLQKQTNSDVYFNKFLSLDALRASFKTFAHFLKDSKDKPRFDSNGWTGHLWNEDFIKKDPKTMEQTFFSEEEVLKGYRDVKTIEYKTISSDRLQYVQNIVSLCEKNDINYTFFVTPLNGQLLSKVYADPILSQTLEKFKSDLSNITCFYDFLTHNKINDNRQYFGGDTMHTTPFTGDLILARIFGDTNITLPDNFGVFRAKKLTQP